MKKRKFINTIATTFVVGLIILFSQQSFPQVNAQQTTNQNQDEEVVVPNSAALSLSVHPPVAYVAVKPSEKLKHTLVVKNHGKEPLEISVNITDFKADGKTGQPVLQPGKIFNRTANPDLQFGESFVLQPGKNHSISLQIDVNDVASEKEYPLAIMVNARSLASSENADSNQDNSSSQVAGTVVSNLIVYIGESESNQGKLGIANLNMPLFIDSFTGIRFDVLAENTGNTATLIQGSATIKNIFKQSIVEYIFYPDFVLANSTRMVRGTKLNSDMLDAEGLLDPEKVDTLFTQFHYKPPLMIGLYEAHFVVGEQTQTKSIIALPFSLVVLVGLGWMMHWGWKQIVKRVR